MHWTGRQAMTAVAGDRRTASNEQLWQLSAGELAARIARGESSGPAVVEAHIARIEAVNPAPNAMVAPRFDAPRREAQEADARQAAGERLGPLHGVPITVKECLDLAGSASTFGIPARATERAMADDCY